MRGASVANTVVVTAAMASFGWLSGCAKSSRGEVEARQFPPPKTTAEYFDALAELQCEAAARCCVEAAYRGVRADCWELQSERYTHHPFVPYAIDGARAAACLQAIAALPCEPVKINRVGPLPSACRDRWERGDAALGEPCEEDLDCAQPAGTEVACKLRITPDGIEGDTCAEVEVLTLGQACGVDAGSSNAVVTRCEGDLMCNDEPWGSGTCEAPAQLGEPCIHGTIWGDTCAAGAVCDRLRTKRCVEPVPVGEPCDSLEQCEGHLCVEGLCRATTPNGMHDLCEP